MSRLQSLAQQRDNCQSQLDVLCGECPDTAEALIKRIASLERLIEWYE